jgi:hypothetical protein
VWPFILVKGTETAGALCPPGRPFPSTAPSRHLPTQRRRACPGPHRLPRPAHIYTALPSCPRPPGSAFTSSPHFGPFTVLPSVHSSLFRPPSPPLLSSPPLSLRSLRLHPLLSPFFTDQPFAKNPPTNRLLIHSRARPVPSLLDNPTHSSESPQVDRFNSCLPSLPDSVLDRSCEPSASSSCAF